MLRENVCPIKISDSKCLQFLKTLIIYQTYFYSAQKMESPTHLWYICWGSSHWGREAEAIEAAGRKAKCSDTIVIQAMH